MNRNILSICAFVLAVLLAGIVTDDGVAGTSDKAVKKGAGSFSRPEARTAVTVAGTLNGSLQGQIRLSGREVVITKHTRIYRTGKGLIEYGSLVTNSPVYVIGDAREGGAHEDSFGADRVVREAAGQSGFDAGEAEEERHSTCE